jgi:dTDP-4-amino-4,6-dideoxygalactose transaminase
MLQLESLCRQNGLHLIQDAAQAHLAMLGSRPLGSFGTACFSFFASKNMTTGEGGMVVTTDEKVGRRLRMLVNHGRNECGEFEMLGFNFRMSEMCAALGVVQLEKLPELTRKRIENAAYYDAAITQLSTPVVLPNAHHVYHQYTLLVPRDLDRDRIVSSLHRAGIEARIYYQNAIHQLPAVQKYPRRQGSLLVTEDLTRRVLSIPVHPEVTAEQRAFVVESLQRACSDDAD